MVEVITMQGRNGVFLGLDVEDSVNTCDVVTEASLTLGIEHEMSSLRYKMHKVVECQTSYKILQNSYTSQSSVALVLYLHSETKPTPLVQETHTVQKVLIALEEKIQQFVHCAREKKHETNDAYNVFNEPSMWTGVEPMEEEPIPALKKQNCMKQHFEAAVQTKCYVNASREAMFGKQDTFTTLLEEFEQNGV